MPPIPSLALRAWRTKGRGEKDLPTALFERPELDSIGRKIQLQVNVSFLETFAGLWPEPDVFVITGGRRIQSDLPQEHLSGQTGQR